MSHHNNEDALAFWSQCAEMEDHLLGLNDLRRYWSSGERKGKFSLPDFEFTADGPEWVTERQRPPFRVAFLGLRR